MEMGEVATAEAELAAALATLIKTNFPRSQGLEARVDSYLALNELLRLDDSEASVQLFRAQLPALLREFRHDLQHATLPEVLQLCLRSLSYFMHHKSMAAVFPDAQVSFFLGEIVRLLYSTQEENFEEARHRFLPRTVEGLVQAVVNPFKSRTIELQALKGLHLLLLKYPQQVARNPTVLSIWFKPVTSRISSSRAETRTQARVVLQEASGHVSKWSESTLEMVQHCMQTYALPTMKTHMANERQKEALHLWQLTLTLLQTRLATDLALLNSLLYVPEGCMRHGDAAVRLLSMQTWAGLVDVFHRSKEWLFKKPVVHLLVWPILVCLEDELLLNVVEAAFASWRKIVVVAVQDFNTFCVTQSWSIEAAQQTLVPMWKRWLNEMVMKPVATLVRVRLSHSGGEEVTSAPELVQFITFARSLWDVTPIVVGDKRIQDNENDDGDPSALNGDGAVETSVDATKSTQLVLDMDDTVIKSVAKLSTPRTTGPENVKSARISSDVLAIAFLLPDVFDMVQKLSQTGDATSYHGRLSRDLAVATWSGMCTRLHSSKQRQDDAKSSKSAEALRLRLSRLCLDFAFGVSPPRVVIAEAQPGNADTEQSMEESEESVSELSVSFDLSWQLRLLEALVSGFKSSEGLGTLLLHPKSRSLKNVTKRLEHVEKHYPACVGMLDKWREATDCRLDFSLKANALPCVAMVLMLEFAVDVDSDTTGHSASEKRASLVSLRAVLDVLVKAMRSCDRELSRGVEAVVHFVEAGIDAARTFLGTEGGEHAESAKLLEKLLVLCLKPSKQIQATPQNALQLLELQKSRQGAGIVTSVTTRFASPANPPAETCAGADSTTQGEAGVASSRSTSSTPVPSQEVAAMSSLNIPEPRSSSSKEQQGVTHLPTAAKDVPTTPHRTPAPGNAQDAECDSQKMPRPAGSRSAPPKMSAHSPQTPSQPANLSSTGCVYPDLVNCSEGISQLNRHFPLQFRPFFTWYKIKTVGDLSAMPVEKVKTFGMKDPVLTVWRALKEFSGRKKRMESLQMSPYRHRTQQSPARSLPPASMTSLASPSSGNPGKRPLHGQRRDVAALSDGTPRFKRSRRSLAFGEPTKTPDSADKKRTEEYDAAQQKPKIADRVTFCIPSNDTGATKIARPGEDSQEANPKSAKQEEKESMQDEMGTYASKMLQHLRRSVHYMDKLAAGETSVQADATMPVALPASYHEASILTAKLSAQLEVAMKAQSGRRCSPQGRSGGPTPGTPK